MLIIYLIYKNIFNTNDSFKNKVSEIETKVELIDYNNFSNYKKELDNLYTNCVFSDGIFSDIKLNNPTTIMFILKNNNKIIGSLQIDDFDKLNKEFYIDVIGAIKNKKGLYLTFLCSDKNYKGITAPLFEAVEKYAKDNNFEYILLEAKLNWRKTYYKKFGYNNIKDDEYPSMIKYL